VKVVILCLGSRGDVQPHIALAQGLTRAGHHVRLATHSIFRDLVATHGLEYAPLESNPQEILQGEAGQTWLAAGRNPLRSMHNFATLARPMVDRALSECWSACVGADAIIFTILAFAAYNIAEKLQIPCFASALQPLTRTRDFAAMSTRSPGFSAYNRLTHLAAEQVMWQPFRQITNQWRRDFLQLPPLPFTGPFSRVLRQRLPHLYGYSPAVVPKPSDWPEHLHVTGYWFLDRPPEWQPPAHLLEFLEAGPPPVYVGFGSMIKDDPAATTDLVLKALALTGQRGVLLTGWGGLGGRQLPSTVFQLDSIPHDWLFPRVAAVVHHGGAGTTAAALRAGVPSVTIPFLTPPFFSDQVFWGDRVRELGAGTGPILQSHLTAERLAAAIHAATTTEGIRSRAAALGQQIRAEDGIRLAVEAFERHSTTTDWEKVWSTR
jgi:sterol 3beta-glucosyltransferase